MELNITFKRKAGLEGAKAAPYETVRLLTMRESHRRKIINEQFPKGAEFVEWEYLAVVDEKQFVTILHAELEDMIEHYEIREI